MLFNSVALTVSSLQTEKITLKIYILKCRLFVPSTKPKQLSSAAPLSETASAYVFNARWFKTVWFHSDIRRPWCSNIKSMTGLLTAVLIMEISGQVGRKCLWGRCSDKGMPATWERCIILQYCHRLFLVYTLFRQVSQEHQPREECRIFRNENLSYTQPHFILRRALLTVSDRIQIPSKTTHKDTGTKVNTYYFIS